MSNYCYGYWVSRDEIYEVPSMSHFETALEIIEKLYGIEGRRRVENHTEHSLYRFMFHLGFIRVVNDLRSGGDDYSVQYRAGTKLSKLQKEFVKGAQFVDVDGDPRSYGVMYW